MFRTTKGLKNYKWTLESGTLTGIFIFVAVIPVITYGLKIGNEPIQILSTLNFCKC